MANNRGMEFPSSNLRDLGLPEKPNNPLLVLVAANEIKRAKEAEQRANEAEQRANEAEKRAKEAEQRANEAEQRANEAEKRSITDSLTGFENRRGLRRYRDNLKPDEYPVLLLIFDLDNLKKINDDPINGGHQKGNEYILSFVKFVNELFPNNKKFRLGGDEFAVPIKNINFHSESDEKNSETIFSKLEVFNNKEQRQHKLELTHAFDIASSPEDFSKSLTRADLKEVEAKKIKKLKQLGK